MFRRRLMTLLLVFSVIVFSINQTISQENYTSGLEALLVVGHQEDGTVSAIEKMDKIAGLLEESGIVVHAFYDDKAYWQDIKDIAPKCSFFIYSGHGSVLGEDGNAGGICINSMVSTETLIKELQLKNNALVIFKSVCRGAGSSAGDDGDIGIEEAKTRVTHYAYPFFEVGAVAYYANNYGNGVYSFLKDFLSGVKLGEAYKTSATTWTTIEFEEPFSRDNTKSFSIASSSGGGTTIRTTYINGVKSVEEIPTAKGYKIAFVGSKEFSVKDMK
jgi:hypothetical protein